MKRKQEPKPRKKFSQTYTFSNKEVEKGKSPFLPFGVLFGIVVIGFICYGGWLSFRGKQSATVMRVGGEVSYMPSWQQGQDEEEHPNRPVILFPFQSTDINQAYLLTQDFFINSKFSFIVSTNTKSPSDITQILDELEVSSIALLCVIGEHNICLDFLASSPEKVWGSLFFPTKAPTPSFFDRLLRGLFSASPQTWEEWIQAYNLISPPPEGKQPSSLTSSLCSYLHGSEVDRWSIISFEGEGEGEKCHLAFESLERKSNVPFHFHGFSSGQMLIW